jgi:hypothetical protein
MIVVPHCAITVPRSTAAISNLAPHLPNKLADRLRVLFLNGDLQLRVGGENGIFLKFDPLKR